MDRTKEVLSLIGKPFYLIIYYFLLSLSLAGKLARKPFGINLRLQILKIRKLAGKLLPKAKLPQVKVGPIGVLIIPLILVFSFWLVVLKGLPSPSQLTTRDQEISTKIYDRNNVLLYTIYKNQNRTPISISEVPPQVILATLAAEDAEFYSHPGFSVRGITRALFKNLKEGKLQGGSTITQQLVKNALLSPEKTVVRKIKELVLAVEVEITYSKEEILEMYLNEVSYGGTAYGIAEAARIYFDKSVKDLTPAEAALLAGLPKSPTRFSPFGSDPEAAITRQQEVIDLMAQNKFITKEQSEEIKNEKFEFSSKATDIKAPHFVMYVKQELVNMYGDDMVEKGGLNVVTTLDYTIQSAAEEIVAQEVDKLARLSVGNGAAIVSDPKSGEILAMVGSKNYFDTISDGNVNVTIRPRLPGSSIKAVNYAYALSHGYTAGQIIADTPVSFSLPGQPPYIPKNYDGGFRGYIPIRNALAESRNIPAVKILASYGVGKMIEQGQKMGITTWGSPERFGLSLTLGGGEVKLIDLTKVYETLANYGKRSPVQTIIKVTDYKGRTLFDGKKKEPEQVLDPRVAFILTDILKDNSARAGAFGTSSLLNIAGHKEVAVKTGTSNNLKDNLAVGYTRDFVVAVWVGNNDNTPMARIASGITGATPIWNKIMSHLLKDKGEGSWEVPSGLVQKANCYGRPEWFLAENQKLDCNLLKKQEEEKAKAGLSAQTGQITPEAASTSR